jgi:large subunit ribosomal protein L24
MQKQLKNTIHVKKGDTVQILTGKDKGKVGEVIKIIKGKSQVVVEDINIKKKHIKPSKEGEVGKISEFEGPIHSSNVMLYSKENKLASRTGYKVDETGKKIRVLKKLLT